ncbi:MAG TPA: hypothetical protein VJ103_02620 [Candidatus Paceibacterota bacterium]|nr:hypothetical protein [Candidatus Paceibacterota bacterium]
MKPHLGYFGESPEESIKKELLGTTKPREALPLNLEFYEYQEHLENFLKKEDIGFKFEKILDEIKKRQRFDPTKPVPSFAHDLYLFLADELGIEEDQELKYFTAIGPEKQKTAADVYYNIQAFFEWEKDPGKIKRVTFRLHHKDYDKRSSTELDANIYIPDDLAYPISYRGLGLKLKDLTPHEQKRYTQYINKTGAELLDLFKKTY